MYEKSMLRIYLLLPFL